MGLGLALGAVGCTHDIPAAGTYEEPTASAPEGIPAGPRRQTIHASPAALTDVATCARCHADVAAEWSDSLHAFSGTASPWFAEAHAAASDPQACEGCHQLGLAPTAELPTVTCRACHGGVTVHAQDGPSLVLASVDPALLDPDADHLAAHTAAMAAPASVCTTCHRPTHPGTDRNSAMSLEAALAVLLEPQPQNGGCVACHMAPTARALAGAASTSPDRAYPDRSTDRTDAPAPSRGRSHRMPGSHLASAPSRAQHAAVEQQYAESVDLHIISTEIHEDTVVVDIVVFHTGSPHAWPGRRAATLSVGLVAPSDHPMPAPIRLTLGPQGRQLPPDAPRLVRVTLPTNTHAEQVRAELHLDPPDPTPLCTSDTPHARAALACVPTDSTPPASRALPHSPGPRLVSGPPVVATGALAAADQRAWVQPRPADPTWTLRAVQAALHHGALDHAATWLAGLPPNTDGVPLLQARLALATGEAHMARVDAAPRTSLPHVAAAALAQLQTGAESSVSDLLQAAAVRAPTDARVLRAWALAEAARGDTGHAARIAAAGRTLLPDDPTFAALVLHTSAGAAVPACTTSAAACPPVWTPTAPSTVPAERPGR